MEIRIPEFKEEDVISTVNSGANLPPGFRHQLGMKSIKMRTIWSYKRRGEIKSEEYSISRLAQIHAVTGVVIYTSANYVYFDLDGPIDGIAQIHELIVNNAGDRFLIYEEYEQSFSPSTLKVAYVETPDVEISTLDLFKNQWVQTIFVIILLIILIRFI